MKKRHLRVDNISKRIIVANMQDEGLNIPSGLQVQEVLLEHKEWFGWKGIEELWLKTIYDAIGVETEHIVSLVYNDENNKKLSVKDLPADLQHTTLVYGSTLAVHLSDGFEQVF